MDEKFLLKISIACALIGLVVLFWVSRNLEMPTTKIREISIGNLGDNVKVCGKIVSKFTSRTNHIFLQLADDSDNIEIVIFNKTVQTLRRNGMDPSKINKYDSICVTGRVEEYKEKLEIIAKKIEGM